MTLAGLIKHMAFVEDRFSGRAAEQPLGSPWDTRTWLENDQWGWASAVTDDPDDLYALWYAAAGRLQHVEGARFGRSARRDHQDDDPDWSTNRRRILIDLLEEYLKHTGHADVLREAVDSLRGNDPD